MARKMGISYDRIDISAVQSHTNGATVPTAELSSKLEAMISQILQKPTCIIPDVLTDPYFNKI